MNNLYRPENHEMYCEACDRFEDDSACLDTETCGECGGNLTLAEVDDCSHCNKPDLVKLQFNGMCETCAEDMGWAL